MGSLSLLFIFVIVIGFTLNPPKGGLKEPKIKKKLEIIYVFIKKLKKTQKN